MIELAHCTKDEVMQISPATLDELTKVMSKYYTFGEPPVFIVDEFASRLVSPKGAQSAFHGEIKIDPLEQMLVNRSRLIRNAFRSSMFPLIVCGTDTKAANMMNESSDETSRLGAAYKWCYIVTNLIPFKFETVHTKIPGVISEILKNSRPWFSTILFNQLVDLNGTEIPDDFLDCALAKIAQNVTSAKCIFESELGALSQILLFRNWSYSPQDSADMINAHFATLVAPGTKKDFWLFSDRTIESTNSYATWRPEASFPLPTEDCLLSLTLLGCKGFSPFQDDKNCPISLYAFMQVAGVGGEIYTVLHASFWDRQR